MGRNDLPGHAVFVCHPAALLFFSALGELLPEFIDFLLRLAIHGERYGRRKGELRSAVETAEFLAVELERDDHYRALRPRPLFAVAADADDIGILDNRAIKSIRLFGLSSQPLEWRVLLMPG